VTEADTRTVEQTLRISARPETVWRFWTDPAAICDWWGSSAELDPQPGGTCRVQMDSGPLMVGEYVELVPYERIVFTFGWERPAGGGGPDVPPGSTRVEVTLVDEDGDTVLTLRHSGLPSSYAEEHSAGWAHFLPLLASAAGAR
jgi:uncharacterized protein YndB with AHSA1/START domain